MQKDLKLNWARGVDGWMLLDQLNLNDPSFNDLFGVYVLWSSKEILKVGSGRIRDEIQKDKTNREITEQDGLMITWAGVEPDKTESVKKYLISLLKPEMIEPSTLEAIEISANTPWDETNLI